MAKVRTIDLLAGLKYAGVPTNIVGDFGTGKSSMIYQLGEFFNTKVVMRSLVKMDPNDFSGVQYLSDDLGPEYDRQGKVILGPDGNPKLIRMVKIAPAPFIRELLENPDAILFLDEINRASPTLQSAALTLIQDGDAGDTKISKSIWRVAAMNAFDVGVNSFSMAAANRFCHIHHKADPEAFKEGFITGFKEKPEVILNSKEEITKKRLAYKTAVINFISENPHLLCNVTDEMSDEMAFPTPRTWELVTEIMCHLDKNTSNYLSILVAGCVGKEAGKLFMKYVENKLPKLVDITEYLGKENKFVLPNPDRVDEVYQLLQSLQYWFNQDPVKFYELWKRFIVLLHNKDKKYGKYVSHDNLLMKYWMNNFVTVTQKVIKGDSNKLSTLREELEGAFEIFTVNN